MFVPPRIKGEDYKLDRLTWVLLSPIVIFLSPLILMNRYLPQPRIVIRLNELRHPLDIID